MTDQYRADSQPNTTIEADRVRIERLIKSNEVLYQSITAGMQAHRIDERAEGASALSVPPSPRHESSTSSAIVVGNKRSISTARRPPEAAATNVADPVNRINSSSKSVFADTALNGDKCNNGTVDYSMHTSSMMVALPVQQSNATQNDANKTVLSPHNRDEANDIVTPRFEACAKAIADLAAAFNDAMLAWHNSRSYEPESITTHCQIVQDAVQSLPYASCCANTASGICGLVFSSSSKLNEHTTEEHPWQMLKPGWWAKHVPSLMTESPEVAQAQPVAKSEYAGGPRLLGAMLQRAQPEQVSPARDTRERSAEMSLPSQVLRLVRSRFSKAKGKTEGPLHPDPRRFKTRAPSTACIMMSSRKSPQRPREERDDLRASMNDGDNNESEMDEVDPSDSSGETKAKARYHVNKRRRKRSRSPSVTLQADRTDEQRAAARYEDMNIIPSGFPGYPLRYLCTLAE